MRTILSSFACWFAFAAFAQAAATDPAAELNVPIGRSSVETIEGRVGSIAEPAADGQPLAAIAAATDGPSFIVGPDTRIYLDRSAQQLPNILGDVSDLKVGRVIEVYAPDPATRVAEWVKVRP